LRELVIESLQIAAPLSVALIVFAEALAISLRDVIAFFRERPGTMLTSLAAALVFAPAAALGLILVLEPAPAVAVGLAILMSCPPAPLMIKSAPTVGGGNAAFMASLHLSLAVLAVVTVPAVLHAMAIPLGFEAGVAPVSILSLLAKTILIPIALGLAVRALWPAWADRVAGDIGKAGSIGLLVIVIAILAALYRTLLSMDGWSYLVIAIVCLAALAIGHWIGSSKPEERTILAVECAVRHPGLAVAIGSSNFTPQQALPVLVPCIVSFILIGTAYLFWRGRSKA
jgi:BASS family bile acid:Na+ symporter